jgi:cell division protein FtsW
MIAVAMFFVSGASLLHLSLGVATLLGIFAILIKSAPYRLQRFLVFLNPADEKLGAGYHINQALLAVGSGGLWGLGFGQSKQKYLYLPEPHTDSIFAIISEELGFLRSVLILIVFLIIILRCFKVAKNAPDQFSSLLVTGITVWILVQFLVNIGAMLGVLPLTGIPLPFVSYGGSSLIMLMVAIGIVLNISKQSKTNN